MVQPRSISLRRRSPTRSTWRKDGRPSFDERVFREEKALVDAVRDRTRRTRTDHWAQVGYDCFRSDHLAIADGVPEPRRRDPAPGLRRNTPVRYNWVSTQSECQSIKPMSIIGSLRMEWILSNRESLAGSSGRLRTWIFEKWISYTYIYLYFSWRVSIRLKLNHEGVEKYRILRTY